MRVFVTPCTSRDYETVAATLRHAGHTARGRSRRRRVPPRPGAGHPNPARVRLRGGPARLAGLPGIHHRRPHRRRSRDPLGQRRRRPRSPLNPDPTPPPPTRQHPRKPPAVSRGASSAGSRRPVGGRGEAPQLTLGGLRCLSVAGVPATGLHPYRAPRAPRGPDVDKWLACRTPRRHSRRRLPPLPEPHGPCTPAGGSALPGGGPDHSHQPGSRGLPRSCGRALHPSDGARPYPGTVRLRYSPATRSAALTRQPVW